MKYFLNALTLFLLLFLTSPVSGATFDITNGDTAALIAAINTANGNDEANTINLDGSNFTFTDADNAQNAIPLLTSEITILGNSSILERSSATGTANFRFATIDTGAVVTLDRMTLKGFDTTGDGGCLQQIDGNLTVQNSTLDSCGAGQNGGGIFQNNGTLNVLSSLITNNLARDALGGGIRSEGNSTNTFIINSTINGNNAEGEGGGVGASSTNLFITNCLIIDNTIDSNGTGAGIDIFGSGTYIANNTILVNNRTGSGGILNCLVFFGILTGDNNTVDVNNSCMSQGFNSVVMDRDCIGPLADNGGPTFTHALLDPNTTTGCDDNPAIDRGNVTLCPSTDQRGVSRPQPMGGMCDIGALEFQPVGMGICNMEEFFGDDVDNNGDGVIE